MNELREAIAKLEQAGATHHEEPYRHAQQIKRR